MAVLRGGDQVTVHEQSRIWAAPDGNYFLTSNWEPGVIKVFSPNGNFLTEFGRYGNDTGQYIVPQVVHRDNTDGLIYVFDRHRVTSLNADFEVVDYGEIPFTASFVEPLDANRFVVFAAATTPEHIGLPLHVYDHRAGEVVHSFGAQSERVTNRNRSSSIPRAIAVTGADAVWSARWNRYEIERWSVADDSLQFVIRRDAKWFPPWGEPPPGTVLSRPPSTVLWRLSEDTRGRLWVLIHTAAVDWQPQQPKRREGDHQYISDEQYNEIYDSILEIVVHDADGLGANLYASQRLPGRILGFAGKETVYMYAADQQGDATYVLLRPRVVP